MNITASVEISNAQYKQLESDFMPFFEGDHTTSAGVFKHVIRSDGVVVIATPNNVPFRQFNWNFNGKPSTLRQRIREAINEWINSHGDTSST